MKVNLAKFNCALNREKKTLTRQIRNIVFLGRQIAIKFLNSIKLPKAHIKNFFQSIDDLLKFFFFLLHQSIYSSKVKRNQRHRKSFYFLHWSLQNPKLLITFYKFVSLGNDSTGHIGKLFRLCAKDMKSILR